jgi:hypothetical protein
VRGADGIFAFHHLASFRYLASYWLDCVFWLFNASQQAGEVWLSEFILMS